MYTVKTRYGQVCTVVAMYDMACRWIEAHMNQVAPNDPWMLICYGNPEQKIRYNTGGRCD